MVAYAIELVDGKQVALLRSIVLLLKGTIRSSLLQLVVGV